MDDASSAFSSKVLPAASDNITDPTLQAPGSLDLGKLTVIESERPHVLVSDIGMPEIDGYEFLRRVRALTQKIGPHIPAVALTAYAGFEDKTRALRAGYLVHLAKPVEPSELVATLASLTGRAGNLAVP